MVPAPAARAIGVARGSRRRPAKLAAALINAATRPAAAAPEELRRGGDGKLPLMRMTILHSDRASRDERAMVDAPDAGPSHASVVSVGEVER
jgi:hypothetical protein